MSVQVFVNGKEYDFAANRKSPRQPSAFEQGFDAAARGRPESDNPFPAFSPEGADWQAGRLLYCRRRAQYQWFKWPDAGHPFKSTQSDITHLCLVINDIGLYSHMPCQFVAMLAGRIPIAMAASGIPIRATGIRKSWSGLTLRQLTPCTIQPNNSPTTGSARTLSTAKTWDWESDMLQAITRNKSNIHRRYLGHRDIDEYLVREEDELTALLLGPLELLPETANAYFWYQLLKTHGAQDLPDDVPTGSRIQFWPSRKTRSGTRIEPDIEVVLRWPNGANRTLVIELKWRAPLSGKRQLHDQWREYLTVDERMHGFHLFIAPETSAALRALTDQDVWRGKLIPLNWHTVLASLRSISASQQQEAKLLHAWSSQVTAVLTKLHIHEFNGFDSISTARHLEGLERKGLIFWRGFSGFDGLKTYPQRLLDHSSIFFENGL